VDGNLFDRISRKLASSAPRRATLRATVGAAFAGMSAASGFDAIAGKKNKKRCRKRLKKCGGRKKCCNGSGLIKCQNVQDETRPECDGFSWRRCCGLDGASCNPDKGDCECCLGTSCVERDGVFRCTEPLT
jgi:hypothetical protein